MKSNVVAFSAFVLFAVMTTVRNTSIDEPFPEINVEPLTYSMYLERRSVSEPRENYMLIDLKTYLARCSQLFDNAIQRAQSVTLEIDRSLEYAAVSELAASGCRKSSALNDITIYSPKVLERISMLVTMRISKDFQRNANLFRQRLLNGDKVIMDTLNSLDKRFAELAVTVEAVALERERVLNSFYWIRTAYQVLKSEMDYSGVPPQLLFSENYSVARTELVALIKSVDASKENFNWREQMRAVITRFHDLLRKGSSGSPNYLHKLIKVALVSECWYTVIETINKKQQAYMAAVAEQKMINYTKEVYFRRLHERPESVKFYNEVVKFATGKIRRLTMSIAP